MTIFDFLSKFMDEKLIINEYDKMNVVYKNVYKGRIYDLLDNRDLPEYKRLLKMTCFCAFLDVDETLVINVRESGKEGKIMKIDDNDHYFIVSWCNGKVFMLFDDIYEAQTQFHYECVFEDNVKLETITKEKYNELVEYIRKEK